MALQDIVSACIAVAGPVADNTVTFTNRGEWVIRGEDVSTHWHALLTVGCWSITANSDRAI